jgi:apolipoprotein D and lipocalin family protein
MIKRLLFFIPILISGCVDIPENVSPVTGFDIDRYLGTWYEIARLDHSFERGLEKVAAEYSLRNDGVLRLSIKGSIPKKIDGKRRSAKHTLSMIQVLAG